MILKKTVGLGDMRTAGSNCLRRHHEPHAQRVSLTTVEDFPPTATVTAATIGGWSGRALDQLDAIDRVFLLPIAGAVTEPLAVEVEGGLRAGQVDDAAVVGEVDAVLQRGTTGSVLVSRGRRGQNRGETTTG